MIKRSQLRKILGIGNETFRKWFDAGLLPTPIVINGRNSWRLSEVRAWLDACPRRGAQADQVPAQDGEAKAA